MLKYRRFCAFKNDQVHGNYLCHLTMSKGPKSNPANLPVGSQQTIYELFADIFCAAIATATDKHPVRYLSR